jgi:biotin operon repressor
MDEKEQIKEAFTKVKEDIEELKDHLSFLTEELLEIKRTLDELKEQNQTDKEENPPFQQINPTHSKTPTDNLSLKALKTPILDISIGNDGVPTDRQTNQQTDRHIPFKQENPIQNPTITLQKDKISQIEHISSIIDSLDSIKKDLRTKFKHLTKQEMLIFSTLYQLEEEQFAVDYSVLSEKLQLSESSIRDYIQKIIKKGVPIEKIKENNKKILLKIPQDLKKIASLQTIMTLREL